MKFKQLLVRFVAPLLAIAALAPAHADDDIKNIRKMLTERFPAVPIHSVVHSKAPGWIEVIAGSQVVYFDKAGEYMFDGSLVDMKSRVNLTEAAKSGMRLRTINKIKDDEMLVYRPEKVDHTVTIVTDVDCPYCRKLHSEMDDYMENNVKVRYIFMPLKGMKDYKTTVSVWCSDDRNLALDIAKAGGEIEQQSCDNPLNKHKRIARELGIKGTPAIVLEDGRLLPGYVPIGELVKELNAAKS